MDSITFCNATSEELPRIIALLADQEIKKYIIKYAWLVVIYYMVFGPAALACCAKLIIRLQSAEIKFTTPQ